MPPPRTIGSLLLASQLVGRWIPQMASMWRQTRHHATGRPATMRTRDSEFAGSTARTDSARHETTRGAANLKTVVKAGGQSCAQSVAKLIITGQYGPTLPGQKGLNEAEEPGVPTLDNTNRHDQSRTLNPLVRVRIPAWHPRIRDTPLVPEALVLSD